MFPSFRGEAVGVAGSDELTSSTCVFDAVDGVGLRRKTIEIICTIIFLVCRRFFRLKSFWTNALRFERVFSA